MHPEHAVSYCDECCTAIVEEDRGICSYCHDPFEHPLSASPRQENAAPTFVQRLAGMAPILRPATDQKEAES